MPLPHFLRHFFCYDPFPDMLPRRERRKPSLMYFIPIADFNPRSREGSDQWLPILFVHSKISIHAPARGATVKELCEIVWGEFQSTLPRGERRVFLCHVTDNRSISIHAPARGATKQAAAPFRNCSYFNPRSREWSDGNDGTNGKDGKDFNPRSREWSDARGRGGGAAEGISIHAPASGATGDEYLELLPESISIHAPARGATRKDLCCLQQGCDFNPRSREWSDRYIPVIVLLRHISIHAPASGATQTADANKTTLQISIHAPASGATFNDQTFRPFMPISIHAPASGATRICLTFNFLSSISIHAPASGATCSSDKDRDTEPFQSTLPRVERRPVFLTDNAVFHFNPRSREWSDRRRTAGYSGPAPISIHAPASGATCLFCRRCCSIQDFNPRSREWSDGIY